MTPILRKVTLLMICLALFGVPAMVVAKEAQRNGQQQECIKPKEVKLQGDMRKLWVDHMIWTRGYLISALAGLEDQEKVLARLLKNQVDIGNAIKPYYGEEAGKKLAELLSEHIVIAGKIIDAAKKGDQATLEKLNKEWFRNADDIAKFLSSANPNWPEKDVKEMMYTHLKLLSDNLQARLKKDWDADIAAFDKGEEHIISMADVLTAGIIKQFPNQF
ncbi:glycosyltransferase [Brevibacillus sp. DP1.3A]|uniref:glycosyltransferase n=1 Tax=Brevibacillus sp. DP1.3A TaxID=2738867 RepID=UPI00156B9A51|nr:glycosyltransferase [Brevibacillus sp. DP1.3A]UED74834.1 glycosyltransferase [Brevibacillus sp. DP1.3A]